MPPLQQGGRAKQADPKKSPSKKKKKGRKRCSGLTPESTKVKARKSSALKYTQFGKYHERAFIVRGGRGREMCQRKGKKGVMPGKCVRGRGGNEGGEKSFRVGKVGKHPSSIWRGNYGVSLKSRRRSQVEYPYTCNPYHYFLLFITSLLTTGIKYGFQDHPGKLK